MADEQQPSDGRIPEDTLIAEVLGLPPERRRALLEMLQGPRKGKGGRPKKPVLANLPEALGRMADLLLESPRLSERAAAKQIGPPLGISVERLRKCFAADREALMASARSRKNPPPPAPDPPNTPPTPPVAQGPSRPASRPPGDLIHLIEPPSWLQGVRPLTGTDLRRQMAELGYDPNWLERMKAEAAAASGTMSAIREAEEKWRADQRSLEKAALDIRDQEVRHMAELSQRIKLASDETRTFLESVLYPGSKTSL